MNASLTTTITHFDIIPYHGVTAVIDSEAMDVDSDGQRLADLNPDNDIMDTTLESVQAALDKGKAPEKRSVDDAPSAESEIAAATEATEVLERPREGGNDEAAESQMPMCKIPTLTLHSDLLLQSMG